MITRNGLKFCFFPVGTGYRRELKTTEGNIITNSISAAYFALANVNSAKIPTGQFKFCVGYTEETDENDIYSFNLTDDGQIEQSTRIEYTTAYSENDNLRYCKTITNKSENDIIINCVGVVYNISNSEGILISVEKIDSVTIAPNETKSFIHVIRI